MTHICVVNLTTIGSDNGLSPGRCQAMILTDVGILLIGNKQILIGIQTFSFKEMHLIMSSAKWRPFCLGPNYNKTLVIVEVVLVCVPGKFGTYTKRAKIPHSTLKYKSPQR